jgi:hypothetical protein
MNAIRFLQNGKSRLQELVIEEGASILATLKGDLACYYTDAEISRLIGLSPEKFLEEETVYPHLINEAKKRNLPVVPLGSWYAKGKG